MAKRQGKQQQSPSNEANANNETGTTAAVEDAPESGGAGTANAGKAEGEEQLPDIGDIVHYFEREEIVHAADPVRQRPPRPHAAIVTGIELFEGQNLLQLLAFHPSEGATVRRHVRFSSTPEAHTWTWRPIKPAQTARVPMDQLIEAVNIVIRKLHNEAADRLDVEAATGQGAQPLDPPPATDSSPATEGAQKTDAEA